MEFCSVFSQTVRELLGSYQDSTTEYNLRLQLGDDELFIEHDPALHQVRVTYVVEGEPPYKDLEILLAIDDQGRWIPYQFHRPKVGTRVYGIVDPVTHQMSVTDAANQEALVRYCESWGFHLRRQGWLEQATKRPYEETIAKNTLKWPEPTTERPGHETIEEWLCDDGGCEASDGCWTDPDGLCPHGHPSWLLRLGLI